MVKDMNNQLRVKGYVHNVKRLRKKGTESRAVVNFWLQVSANRKRRVVCYDHGKETLLKEYQKSREPIKLENFGNRRSESGSEEEIVLSKRSRIETVSNNDILFEYHDENLEEPEQRFTSLEMIASLGGDEIVSVKGCLKVCPESVQEIVMNKGTGSTVAMVDKCVITDGSGTVRLTLWGDMIQEVVNNGCYIVENVLVKKFEGASYLTTTKRTRISPTEEKFPSITKEYFDSLFEVGKISVEEISLAQDLKKWLSCSKCGKQLSDITSICMRIVKCVKCNAVQPASSCSVKACARIAVRDSEYKLIWLKAYTPILQKMLNQPAPDVTLQSSEEEIYEQLFDQRNITLEYDKSSLVIKGVYFEAV